MPDSTTLNTASSIYPTYGAFLWMAIGLSQLVFILYLIVPDSTRHRIVAFLFVFAAHAFAIRWDAILRQRHWVQGLSFFACHGFHSQELRIVIALILLATALGALWPLESCLTLLCMELAALEPILLDTVLSYLYNPKPSTLQFDNEGQLADDVAHQWTQSLESNTLITATQTIPSTTPTWDASLGPPSRLGGDDNAPLLESPDPEAQSHIVASSIFIFISTSVFLMTLGSLFLVRTYRFQKLKQRNAHAGAYSYKSLDEDKKEIRLLRILPCVADDESISCIVRHASTIGFGAAPTYAAVSYCWGDPEQVSQITVNGCNKDITSNLEELLLLLRPGWSNLEVWVDALCINQEDNKERALQVQRMESIYRKASVVLVWVGKGSAGSDRVMNWLSKGQGDQGVSFGQHFFQSALSDEEPPSPEELRDFVSRPYWRRVWIVQEIAAATDICILCGNKTLILRQPDVLLRRLLDPSHLKDEQASTIRHVFDIRHEYRGLDSLPLLDLLQRTADCTSSEPLDKVYGVLGLAHDRAKYMPEPDYRLSAQQLCQQMTENLITATGNLDVILLGRGQSPNVANTEVPSWCPYFVHPRKSPSWDSIMVKYLTGQDRCLRLGVERKRWNSTGTSIADRRTYAFDQIKRTLKVKGLLVGVVKASWTLLAAVEEANRACALALLATLQIFSGLRLEHMPPMTDTAASRLGTLLEMYHATIEGGVENLDRHSQATIKKEVAKLLNSIFQKEQLGARSDLLSRELVDSFFRALNESLTLRLTNRRDIAWVPRETQEDDHIYLFQGCSMPVVLRPVIKNNRKFTLVGRAYIGRYMEDTHREELEEKARTIEII